jgi:hypothetical protein
LLDSVADIVVTSRPRTISFILSSTRGTSGKCCFDSAVLYSKIAGFYAISIAPLQVDRFQVLPII